MVEPVRPLLRLSGVHAGYERMAVLHGVELEVHPGEIVTLVGANGAGKSTTLNTISGVIKARRGRVEIDGEDVTQASIPGIVKRGVIQVPEGRRLFSELTVHENLLMGAYLRRDKAAIRADIDRVFHLFPRLEERRKQKAGSLSGGEQQMCAIARALMARPRLLLLDEPSLGLAPLTAQRIFSVIKELNEQGVTVFLVEQNAFAALRLAHRGYVMETGAVVMSGPAEELLRDPRVRAAYLGEVA
ncbi:MAG: ABC transporter ATP-binding protein [Candidatus Schekmanbacteria bacterium]|nr:ABC transporter ATP-binding protein [Candidatus Schekmanbacteria bacterium]